MTTYPEGKTFKQERPSWCPHADCCFLRRAMDDLCGGKLPVLGDHGPVKAVNTHRFCIHFDDGSPIVDMQVNASDLAWMRWIMDALDGQQTSWLSKPHS